MSDQQFTKLQEVHEKESNLNKVIGTGGEWLANVAAYGAAVLAVGILAAIFAQNLSNVFVDQTMRGIAIAAALAVGSSTIIFLVWRDKLLKSKAQFYAACVFVTCEIALLTLGALFTFGKAFGWVFPPELEWVERMAIVATLPLVAAEWIVVKALSPSSIAARNEAHTNAEVAKSENLARKQAKLSDAVLTIRQQGVLAQVIGEELNRLPASQRSYFMNLILNNHSDELKDVQDVLKDFMSDKGNKGQQPAMMTFASEGHPLTCPSCGSTSVAVDGSSVQCSKCGAVADQAMFHSSGAKSNPPKARS